MRRRLSGSPVIFSSGAAMRNSPGWCRRAARPAQACVVTAEMPLSILEAPTRARNGRSRDFEIFAPIRESRCRPLFRQLPCRQIVSSRQISNVAEKANGDAARCSKSPKPISSAALSVPRRAANRSPSASTRTIGRSGLHDGGVGRVARARVHRAHRRGGPRVRILLPPAASQLRT
jgi:hypothetical protein